MIEPRRRRVLVVLIVLVVLGMLYSLAKLWLAHRLATVEVPPGVDAQAWTRGAFAHASISARWSLVLFGLSLGLGALCYRLGRAGR